MPKAKKKSVMYQMLVEDPKRDLPSIAKGTKTTLPDTDDDEDNSVNEPQQVGISEYIAKVREKLKRTREENKKAMIEGEVLTRTATARDQIRLEYEENQRIYLAGEAHKEAIAKLKAELRGQVTAQMKAEIYEQLREDIRRNNEGPMKAQLEAEIRVQLVEDLLGPIRAELKPKVEKILKRELETDVREQLLRELPAKLESKIEAAIKPKIEEKLRREIGARLEKEQLARADPVSPLVRPEIDGISYPDLKRLSPDDDFERYGKRRRPSYDYDGEHDADHEKRIADILEEECQQKLQRNLQLIIHQEQAGLDHIDRDISDSNDEDAGLTAKQIIQREYMRSRPIKKSGYFVESEDEYESEVSEHESDASENGGRAMKREHSEHLDEEDEYDFRKHLRTMGNANHWDPHYYTGGYFQQGRKTSRNDEHLDETEGSFDYEDDNEDHTEDLGQSDDNPVDDEETIDEEQEEIVKQPQTIDLRGKSQHDNEDHTEYWGQSDDNPVDDDETIEEQEEIVKQPQTIDLRGTSQDDAIVLDSDDDEKNEDVALPPASIRPAVLPSATLWLSGPAITNMKGPSFQKSFDDEDMSDGYDDDEEDEEIYGAVGGLLDSRGNLKEGDEDDVFDMLNLQGIYDENGDLISKRATTPSENEEDPAVKGMDDDQKYDFYSKRKLVLEAEVEQIRAGLAAEEQAEEEQRILWGTSSYGRYTDGGQANEAHKSDTFHSANLPDDHNDLTGTLYQEKADNEKLMERPMNSRTASIDENYDDFEGAEDDVEEQGRETQKGSNENLKISRSTSFGDDFVKFDDMNENNAADEENEEDGENFAGAEESKPEVDEGCVHKVRTGVEEAQSGEAGLDKADESEPNDDEADGSEPEDESLDEGEEGGYEDEDATEEEGYEDEEEVGEGEYEDEDETEVEEDGDPHDEDADKTLVGLPSPKGPVSAFQPINGSGYKAGFFTPKKTHRDPSNKEISDKLSELKDGKLGMLD